MDLQVSQTSDDCEPLSSPQKQKQKDHDGPISLTWVLNSTGYQ